MTEQKIIPTGANVSGPIIRPSENRHSPLLSSVHERAEELEALVSNYAPDMVTPTWVKVEDFVRTCISNLAHVVSEANGRTQIRFVRKLVSWSTGIASLPLVDVEIFHPSTIASFIRAEPENYPPETLREMETVLTSMSASLDEVTVVDSLLPDYGNSAQGPYTTTDIAALTSWADGQAQPGRRRDAEAVLAFCLGAGLTGAELWKARARNLVFSDEGVYIFVGGERPRSVPVHAMFEARIRARYENTDGGAHLIQPEALRGIPFREEVHCQRKGCREQTVSSRMRSTWLLRAHGLLDQQALAHFSTGYRPGGNGGRIADFVDLTTSAALLRGTGDRW